MLKLARHIVQLPPLPAPAGIPAAPVIHALHLNESPWGPADSVVDAMARALPLAHRYPDHKGDALAELIAQRNDMAADCVVVGAGSNELLFISADLVVNADDEVVAPTPGFPSFAKSTQMRSGTLVPVACLAEGRINVEALLAAITPRTRLVFASSPHNPTGGLLSAAEISRLVQGVPDDVLLHFDEAYYEFGRHTGGCETLPLLRLRKGPWISTRSFSKAYGLAGARIGYGLTSSPELASAYLSARINFSLGSVALAGAQAAFADDAALAALLVHNRERREQLIAGLSPMGYRAMPSAANFVAFLTPSDATGAQAWLRSRGIQVIAFPWADTPGALRISIGSAQAMQAVIAALAAMPGAERAQ